MKSFSKLLFSLLVVLLLAGSLAACNTIEGVGKDTRAAGDALTGAAQDSKAY